MNQLSVSLPNTLYHQLSFLANHEGISLGEYILYALTPQVALSYTVQPVPENDITQQRTSFNTLCQSLGQASPDEISAILAEREVVEPEPGLKPEIIERLQKRIAEKSVT